MVQDTTSGFAQSITPQSDPNPSGKWVSYFLTGPYAEMMPGGTASPVDWQNGGSKRVLFSCPAAERLV